MLVDHLHARAFRALLEIRHTLLVDHRQDAVAEHHHVALLEVVDEVLARDAAELRIVARDVDVLDRRVLEARVTTVMNVPLRFTSRTGFVSSMKVEGRTTRASIRCEVRSSRAFAWDAPSGDVFTITFSPG